MHVGFLTSGGTVHRYILAEVLRVYPDTHVVKTVPSPPAPQPVGKRLSRLVQAPFDAVSRRVHGNLRDTRLAGIDAKAEKELLGGPRGDLDAVAVQRKELASPSTVSLITSYGLDVMVVSGAPILRPQVFRLPRLGTFNLHYGIAPQYRGEDTLFWPMYEEQYDALGVTLHYIDDGVDSGEILAHGFIARTGAESEADLWITAARLGARLLLSFLAATEERIKNGVEGRLRGLSQQGHAGPSRQYFSKDRKAWHDARLAARRLVQPKAPPAEERVKLYFEGAAG
jgi:methionyl-tRNA formyltransferase